MSRFSNPVRFSSTAAYCPDTPITRLIWSPCLATSMPFIVAVPESGLIKVVKTLTAVVFPAPLGPSNAVTVAWGTDKLKPSSARTRGAPRGT